MAVIETWLTQDLKKPVQVQSLCGNFFSHNGNANRIGVRVYDDGEPATLSGTVSGYAVLPDGTTVPCTGTLSGNSASVLLPAAAYVPGNICVTIMLTSGTTITTLAALTGSVVMARTDTQVDPGSVVTDWTNTINAALQTVEGYTGNIIATPYASLTYPVPLGKYCIYNDLLYRCVSPIASSESWTASHWVQVKLADDVYAIKSAIVQLKDEIILNGTTGHKYYNYTTGTLPSEPPATASANIRVTEIDASEGDAFTLSYKCGSYPGYYFIDSNRAILVKSATSQEKVSEIVFAPKGTNKLVIQTIVDSFPYYSFKGLKDDKYPFKYQLQPDLQQGSFDGTTGEETTSTTRVRTGFIFFPTNSIINIYAMGQRWIPYYYKKDYSFDSKGSNWASTDGTIQSSGDICFIRFLLSKNESAFAPADVELKFTQYYSYENTFNQLPQKVDKTDLMVYDETDNFNDSDFSWLPNKLLDQNGGYASTGGAYGSATTIWNCSVYKEISMGNITDGDNTPILSNCCFFKNGVAYGKRKTLNGTTVTIPEDADGIAISFQYASNSGKTMTNDIIRDYFRVSTKRKTSDSAYDYLIDSKVSRNALFEENDVAVNDTLNQCSACSNAVVYDKKYGLFFVEYMTGTRTSYGESNIKICLSVFSPSNPYAVKHVVIDDGNGAAYGLLCNGIMLSGDAKVKIYYTARLGDKGGYYKEYDFLNDTLSDKVEVFMSISGSNLLVTNDTYKTYIESLGYSLTRYYQPIINKITEYDGTYYTAITLNDPSYAVLCTLADNVITPFAVYPTLNKYEFRFYVTDGYIHGVTRRNVSDSAVTDAIRYVYSSDNGANWTVVAFNDSCQSRPDIIEYYGKPLIIYNYNDVTPKDGFPPMHSNRTGIKMIYDGSVIYHAYSKYGIVEHETISIFGDLYTVFSNSKQALCVANGAANIEEGRYVEQGKESMRIVKVGYVKP